MEALAEMARVILNYANSLSSEGIQRKKKSKQLDKKISGKAKARKLTRGVIMHPSDQRGEASTVGSLHA